uniref:dUTPase domain-containing protein n=1 Tax=Globodera pallida TaxID=36090 RepID=A0A183CPZ8_GLOPA
ISFGELDLDDTLVKAVFTTPPEQVKCMRRPFMLRPINPLEDVDDNSLDSSGGVYGGLGGR